MSRRTRRSAVKALVCLCLALTAAHVAGAAEPARGAEIAVGRGFLQWSLPPGCGPSTLSISDPAGEVESSTFADGVAPVLWLASTGSRLVEDGTYTWELRVQPAGAGGAKPSKPDVYYGYFTLRDGDVLPADQPEPVMTPAASPATPRRITAADQMVPDDLIVDGKGCIGLACVLNEPFGSEALRLRQSVVRLRFEDASTAAGFPAGKWQLTINDAGLNGVDRFSIDDITNAKTPFTIRGNAPSNSIYVDTVGKLGLGTAVPAQSLHLAAASTPTVRLEQTGGTPRTWDVAASNASFSVTDVSNGSARPVLIEAGAPTDGLRLAANGKIGIGVDPAAFPFSTFLSIKGNSPGDANIKVQNTAPDGFPGLAFRNHNGTAGFFFGIDNAASVTRFNSVSNFPLIFYMNNIERARITPSGSVGIGTSTPSSLLQVNGAVTATQYITSSSRALKQAFTRVDARNILENLATVPITKWTFVADPLGRRHIGPTAEDFQSAFGLGQEGEGLSLTDVNGVALASIQALYAELQQQRRASEEQRKLIDEQRALIAELQKSIGERVAPRAAAPRD